MSLRKKHHSHRVNRKQQIEHTGFYPYLQSFLEASALKGFSPQTCYRQENHIRRFAAWCEQRQLDSPMEISQPLLEHYRKHLFDYRKSNGNPLALSSQQVMLGSLKSFFKWLTHQYHLPYNPAEGLQVPNPPRRLPRATLDERQIQRLLTQPNTGSPDGLRDRAILELFYSTGLRRSELANLRRNDIDLQKGMLAVRQGKGGKDRYLPIGEEAQYWLKHYLQKSRHQLVGTEKTDHLFLTDYGEGFEGGQLGRIVKGYLKRAGIHIIGSCHLFRHAMATHMLEHGADIRYIQAMLGHEDLNSTQIYARVSIERLREVHLRTHPTARKEKATDNPGSDVNDPG